MINKNKNNNAEAIRKQENTVVLQNYQYESVVLPYCKGLIHQRVNG